MTRLDTVAMALLVAPLGCAQSPMTEAKWITLFDGRNLESFTRAGTANWRVADGLAQVRPP